MWYRIRAWLHHLINPHCDACKKDLECLQCKVLEAQLSQANYQNEQLLAALLRVTTPQQVESAPQSTDNFKPIRQSKSWSRQRAELEANDRATAQLQSQKEKEINEAKAVTPADIAELEKELGIIEEERESIKAGI